MRDSTNEDFKLNIRDLNLKLFGFNKLSSPIGNENFNIIGNDVNKTKSQISLNILSDYILGDRDHTINLTFDQSIVLDNNGSFETSVNLFKDYLLGVKVINKSELLQTHSLSLITSDENVRNKIRISDFKLYITSASDYELLRLTALEKLNNDRIVINLKSITDIIKLADDTIIDLGVLYSNISKCNKSITDSNNIITNFKNNEISNLEAYINSTSKNVSDLYDIMAYKIDQEIGPLKSYLDNVKLQDTAVGIHYTTTESSMGKLEIYFNAVNANVKTVTDFIKNTVKINVITNTNNVKDNTDKIKILSDDFNTLLGEFNSLHQNISFLETDINNYTIRINDCIRREGVLRAELNRRDNTSIYYLVSTNTAEILKMKNDTSAALLLYIGFPNRITNDSAAIVTLKAGVDDLIGRVGLLYNDVGVIYSKLYNEQYNTTTLISNYNSNYYTGIVQELETLINPFKTKLNTFNTNYNDIRWNFGSIIINSTPTTFNEMINVSMRDLKTVTTLLNNHLNTNEMSYYEDLSENYDYTGKLIMPTAMVCSYKDYIDHRYGANSLSKTFNFTMSYGQLRRISEIIPKQWWTP